MYLERGTDRSEVGTYRDVLVVIKHKPQPSAKFSFLEWLVDVLQTSTDTHETSSRLNCTSSESQALLVTFFAKKMVSHRLISK